MPLLNFGRRRWKWLPIPLLAALFLVIVLRLLSIISSFETHVATEDVDKFVIYGSLSLFVLYTAFIILRGFKEGIEGASTVAMTFATVVVALFAWLQIHKDIRASEIENTAKWGKLRNTIWKIMDKYPPQGVPQLTALSNKEKVDWLRDARQLLDSEIDNPVLISNRSCLGHWRNAISTAKMGETLIGSDPSAFERNASSILKDVGYVWKSLVLRSTEVSPTGGRPKDVE